MPKNVIMPALGVNQDTGRLVKWLKEPGAQVRQGEMLLEIETDKAVLELEAPSSGVLRDVNAKAGDEVAVGTVIAMIWGEGEVAGSEASVPLSDSVPVKTEKVTSHISAPVVSTRSESAQPLSRGRVAASPKARRLAAERGIDLNQLATGSAVVAADILQTSAASDSAKDSSVTPSRVWRIMAERTTEAWKSIPHFYLSRDVDASKLVEVRQALQNGSKPKVTFTDLLVKKVAVCLQSHPHVNSAWGNASIQRRSEANIGLAVAVEDGLVVPVITNADKRSPQEIAGERIRLVESAQEGKLTLDDISGGTFTISNLGMYGIDHFQAIVNPPHAAILAVGRIADRVVAVNGQPAVRPVMSLCLSCDHRVVDGARAARFLEDLANAIEQVSPSN